MKRALEVCAATRVCRIARIAALFILGLSLFVVPAGAQQAEPKCPPPTRADNVVDTLHGVQVTDPYRWLEDQESAETRAWVGAENSCTESVLRKLPRAAIEKRLGELLKVDTISIPRERGKRYFFMKRGAGEDLSVIYMREGLDGPDVVLVDPAPLSADHTVSVALTRVSEDGRMIAYGVRKGGQDEVTVHFRDTDTRKDLPDELPRADYFGVSISLDKRTVYYSRLTAEGSRIYSHAMGTDVSADKELFGQGYGRDKIIGADLSTDGHYLLISVAQGAGSERSDIFVMDLRAGGPAAPIVKGIDAYFNAQIAEDTLYLETNWKAPFWRVLAVDLKNPAQDKWREVIPESDARLEGIQTAGGKLVAEYSRNAVTELKIFDASGKPAGAIPLPTLGTAGAMSGRWKSDEAFFSFSSFAIPATVYRYDLKSATLRVWAQPKVPVDSAAFELKQVWFTSKDGTRVPMFLFYKKGLKLEGANPALLTGYGGFDVSETPGFSDQAVVWVEHGGVWAVANMRGGGEFGEAWHHAGMLEKKQNVFDDFIGAGEWLIANKYTNPSKLAIQGGSNGGLLVGAALTQRPDLFRAVVCFYPLLDMVRYHKFLVARWWVPEYGSSDDAEQFKYLYKYSPYQNVRKGVKYPAVLFVTGDGDTRVAPLHARKMAAEMQADTGSDHPVLLLYDTKSGHSGGRPVAKQIEEITDVISFLFWQLGVNAE